MYNHKLFRQQFKSNKIQFVFDFCEKQKGWFKYDDLYNYCIAKNTEYYNKIGKKTEGKPYFVKKFILYFIKIGYLSIDPQKGIKVNPDFIPLNQRSLLK